MSNHGNFTISLDLELYWGMRDVRSRESYSENLRMVHEVVPDILALFETHQIRATWAIVGFLFFSDKAELQNNLPENLPSYQNKMFDPYRYISGDALEKKFHFAPDLVEIIKNTPGQEIGTHTFSHYFCLEDGQTEAQFKSDLQAVTSLYQSRQINCRSIVFPRNQYDVSALETASSLGLQTFRGNQKGWFYQPRKYSREKILVRFLRFSDGYINISGKNTYPVPLQKTSGMVNVKASSFLRPYSPAFRFMQPLQLNRITKAMEFAAKKNEVFHLWWHPHNFGKNISENLAFLEKILRHYSDLREKFHFQSANMSDFSKPSL